MINNSEELKEKNNNQQLNDDTPTGSTFAYTKKYIANDGSLNNNQNLTDNQNLKFRVSLYQHVLILIIIFLFLMYQFIVL